MRRMTRLTTVAVSGLLAVTLVPASPAPQPAEAKATAPFTVQAGLIFNNPAGTTAQERRIITQVEKAIDHAPKGSRIRIAQYLFDLDSPVDKLIAADKRGVDVQMLIDDNKATPQTTRLRKALGTDRKTGSYVAKCSHGCMSSGRSVMHAKFFLFSQSGASTKVSMISSANLYTGNTRGSWNNIHTLVGDTKMYASLNRYFDDMLLDRDQPNYYRTTTSGSYKAYFFPRAAAAGSQDIVMLDVLGHVRCTGAARGYGNNGRTVVRIAQWGWSSARMDIARRLWALQNQGCDVQVIANSFTTSAQVRQTLLRPSARWGQMRFYNARVDTDDDGKADVYMHHKVVAISGVWFGHANTKIVYTGSANFSGPATHSNNEVILRVKGEANYNAYLTNFNYIRDHWTQRVIKAPTLSPARTAEVDRQLDAQLDTQLDESPED